MDFGSNGAKNLIMQFASEKSGAVKICSDSLNGEAIAYAQIPATGNYSSTIDITTSVKNITEYMIFTSYFQVRDIVSEAGNLKQNKSMPYLPPIKKSTPLHYARRGFFA